jgi:hypothetical protein
MMHVNLKLLLDDARNTYTNLKLLDDARNTYANILKLLNVVKKMQTTHIPK